MHHIFVDIKNIDIKSKHILINKSNDLENYNHLVNSLRVKQNETVLCSVVPFISSFDYKCHVEGIDRDTISLIIDEEVGNRELDVNINLYQGLIKSDKFEFVIEKAVELGINEIIPVNTEYSIIKYKSNDKKVDTKIARFNKIAKSAAEQSKRHIIPAIKAPIEFDDLIKLDDRNNTYNLLFYENANGITETKNAISKIKNEIIKNDNIKYNINVVIGPEGGFSNNEVSLVKNANFMILSLGERILRVETASITALSILMYEFDKS